jgi:radical SAM/Cys-rich protein
MENLTAELNPQLKAQAKGHVVSQENSSFSKLNAKSNMARLFLEKVAHSGKNLKRDLLSTVQVNLGKLCNQTCTHCHVDAGPHRTKENMNLQTIEQLIKILKGTAGLKTLDLTGGAPELNPHFRHLVTEAKKLGLEVIDRCNLTVLFEPGQEDLAAFLASNNVRIVASLPCYTQKTVDAQRGDGVFEKSIAGLQLLGGLGYGKSKTIDLVYNPSGAFLPPPQKSLEDEYRTKLKKDYDIEFTNLFALTNLPVKRFAVYLRQNKKLDEYNQLLIDSFNPNSIDGLMCKSLVSVGWQGDLFDCDFNQMEQIPIKMESPRNDTNSADKPNSTLWSISSFHEIKNQIETAGHCFGCTAGQGSSCQGAVAI